MMGYTHYDFHYFVIALGYKAEVIKKYMVDYCSLNGNLTLNLREGSIRTQDGYKPNWNINLIDTGLYTNTGDGLKN